MVRAARAVTLVSVAPAAAVAQGISGVSGTGGNFLATNISEDSFAGSGTGSTDAQPINQF